MLKVYAYSTADLPARTPLLRKSEDESIANKRDGSPVLKKAVVTTQRSELTAFRSQGSLTV